MRLPERMPNLAHMTPTLSPQERGEGAHLPRRTSAASSHHARSAETKVIPGSRIRAPRNDGYRRPRLHRHCPLLVSAPLDGGRLAMACDHAHALVDPGDDVVGGAALQEGDTVVAAGREHALTRRLHFRWVGLARNRGVAERETEVARADLGKSQPRYAEHLFAIGDAFGAFELHPQQQVALRIERPGIAARHVVFGGQAPDRRRGGFRSAPPRADAEQLAAGGVGPAVLGADRSFHPRHWLWD